MVYYYLFLMKSMSAFLCFYTLLPCLQLIFPLYNYKTSIYNRLSISTFQYWRVNYIKPYVRLSKHLVHEKDISIIWKGPIANHSFVAILTSLRGIDLQGVSLRLNTAEVDIILYLQYYSYLYVLLVSTSISCTKILGVLEVIVVRVVLRNWKYQKYQQGQ